MNIYHVITSYFSQTVEEKNVRPLKMVSDQCKVTVFPMLCSTLLSNLDDADYMITRFKSEHVIVSYMKDNEDGALTREFFSLPSFFFELSCYKLYNFFSESGILKRRERELCQHVLHVTLMTKNIISIAAPTGPCLESLIKVLTRNFNVLTSLTKYFSLRSSPNDLAYKNAM